ncbi:MAG: TspO/MBR family protein [Bacilli bacterium]
MKKIIIFPIFLIPWFLGLLIFNIDSSYFNNLNIPFFISSLNKLFIFLTIVYINIAISIHIIYIKHKDIKKTRTYYKLIITNYILNQLSIFCLFTIKDYLLFFLNSITLLVSTLWLYKSIKKLDKIASLFIIIYIIWSFLQTILSISIYLTNP